MLKRVISLILCSALVFSFACFSAFAGESNNYDTCTHEWEQPIDHWYGIPIPGTDITFGVDVERCSKCGLYKHTADLLVLKSTYYSPLPPHLNGLVPSELTTYWLNVWYKTFGENATATKFTPGGGSTSGGGVGRPKGYGDEGKANVNQSGAEILWVEPFGISLDGSSGFTRDAPHNLVAGRSGGGTNAFHSGQQLPVKYVYYFKAPVTGLYYVGSSGNPYNFGSYYYFWGEWIGGDKIYNYSKPYESSISLNKGEECYFIVNGIVSARNDISFKYNLNDAPIFVEPLGDSNITTTNHITINNNTWNGNIYTDNSTNLTYIYPQYTTVNEKNETVTNISNTPIIYNNETKQYYTYDQTTKNYYYITYNAQPTPSPSPTPAPTEKPGGSISTPETGKPGGDTGDTTGILAVLVEIRDNMIQGFLDIKAAFVAGFAELSANFTLAIENLNLNITNIFNKKFPDQSTPETAAPSPSPSPSPSPAPLDPILPETQNLIIPKMNSNTFADEHGTWVASGSSKYSDVFDFFHAFDRSTSDFWETNASPSYLQIEIPDPESYYIDGYIVRISKFNNRYAKDWTLQGSDDGNTWDDLDKQTGQNLSDLEEHKYSLTLRKAYKYYRLNMSNYASSMCSLSHFNLLGYDAKDVVTPTPAPTDPPSPSPAPAPGKPDSGDKTNNFWTIIFPNGGGSEDGKKGVFWALVSLILALIAFFSNLAVGVGYLFPFLPDGVVMTINTCLIVIFLFTIIKFIMRSK